MKGKHIRSRRYPILFRHLFLALAAYRIPMPVTELMVFPGRSAYYVCPRCGITVEREYMRYCDRCGQRLGWRNCERARIVYPGTRTRGGNLGDSKKDKQVPRNGSKRV